MRLGVSVSEILRDLCCSVVVAAAADSAVVAVVDFCAPLIVFVSCYVCVFLAPPSARPWCIQYSVRLMVVFSSLPQWRANDVCRRVCGRASRVYPPVRVHKRKRIFCRYFFFVSSATTFFIRPRSPLAKVFFLSSFLMASSTRRGVAVPFDLLV